MDVRKLGHWLGRLAAVAIFGTGAALGIVAVASADETSDQVDVVDAGTDTPTGGATTYGTSWE